MQWIPLVKGCLTSRGVETLKSKASRTWQDGFGKQSKHHFQVGKIQKDPFAHSYCSRRICSCLLQPQTFTKTQATRKKRMLSAESVCANHQCSDLKCQTLLHYELQKIEKTMKGGARKLPQLWVRVFWWRSFRYCVHKKDEQFSFSKLSSFLELYTVISCTPDNVA